MREYSAKKERHKHVMFNMNLERVEKRSTFCREKDYSNMESTRFSAMLKKKKKKPKQNQNKTATSQYLRALMSTGCLNGCLVGS